MSINKATRQQVIEKYDYHCAYCGVEITLKSMQVDHIIPKVYPDGTDDIKNLNPACRACNNYKGHSRLETFRMFLKQMLNKKHDYLFKSKTKMEVAINFGAVKLEKWDGLFYFEIKLKYYEKGRTNKRT